MHWLVPRLAGSSLGTGTMIILNNHHKLCQPRQMARLAWFRVQTPGDFSLFSFSTVSGLEGFYLYQYRHRAGVVADPLACARGSAGGCWS